MDYRADQPSLDLGGEWHMAFAEDRVPATRMRTIADVEASGLPIYPAHVPGNFELDLLANGLIDEPFHAMNIAALQRYEACHVWYMRRFDAADTAEAEAVLELDGVDCHADVTLNGHGLLTITNMLVPRRVPVSGKLRGENEIVVAVRPPASLSNRGPYPPGVQAMAHCYDGLWVRKAPHMYGWDIMPRALSAGIWRALRLRRLPSERLEGVFLDSLSASSGHATLRLSYETTAQVGPLSGHEIVVTGQCGDSRFHERRRLLAANGSFTFGVPSPRLWWPRGRGDANLYDVRVSLLKDGEETDHLVLRHGIRTVALERTSTTDEEGAGEFVFRVNGEKVFVKGSNWVPLDAYHSRDLERTPPALEMAADLGCNMLRCWGGNVYESDRFFDLCDEKGIMVWQDFAMACAIYPQGLAPELAEEARSVVRRVRQHASLALWAGDNECDQAYSWGGRRRDPNQNRLTRVVLPEVLEEEDPSRPYLPSSPYVDPAAFQRGERYLPENHLWGPRDYYKSPFYTQSLCHFASEIGYHGCPSPGSIRRFVSPDRVWPYRDNPEWVLHSTSPVPGVDLFDYRVELMAKQVRELFGNVPDNLDDFAFASQASQAEALKFFIELFRGAKWRRTGILWWNLLDGWPQFSDAIVDYYFGKKLAYGFVKRAQTPLLVMLREPADWGQDLVASNDTRDHVDLTYSVRDLDTGTTVAEGQGRAAPDAVTTLARVPFSAAAKRFYAIDWSSALGAGRSHYLAGYPPFDLGRYRHWLATAGLV